MTPANRLALWCDDCDRDPLTLTASEDVTADEKAALRALLAAMARRLGWRVTGRRHRCPACRDAVPVEARATVTADDGAWMVQPPRGER